MGHFETRVQAPHSVKYILTFLVILFTVPFQQSLDILVRKSGLQNVKISFGWSHTIVHIVYVINLALSYAEGRGWSNPTLSQLNLHSYVFRIDPWARSF